MTTKTPTALYAGVPKQLQPGDNVATLATDAAWTAKGDTIAATGAGAAAITAVGADGTTHTADSSKSNGVGWSEVCRTSNKPTVSFTLYPNQSMVVAQLFYLQSGVNFIMQSGSTFCVI